MPYLTLTNGYFSETNGLFSSSRGLVTSTTLSSMGANYLGTTSASTSGALGLDIFKGTIPADISEITGSTSRQTDLLISIFGANCTPNPAARSILIGQRRDSSTTVATASGVAEWFIFRTLGTGMYQTHNMIMGTVGVTGSGADLEIDDVNIVSGASYRSNGFTIVFPSTLNFS